MTTFLFDKTIFGPVRSRRLGISLGINLLPNDSKFCSYNCVYCECGWNGEDKTFRPQLPSRETVKDLLEKKLKQMVADGELPDVITFAGNGEPTLHPDFPLIIDDTLELRDMLTPKARVAVLSNSTMTHKPSVVEALKKVDDNILKLDSGIEKTIRVMNKPTGYFSLEKMIGYLMGFEGKLIIQTLFLRGEHNKNRFDNTSEEELEAWIAALKKIKPEKVMIYSIDRDTPEENLIKVSSEELYDIAKKAESQLGIPFEVSA